MAAHRQRKNGSRTGRVRVSLEKTTGGRVTTRKMDNTSDDEENDGGGIVGVLSTSAGTNSTKKRDSVEINIDFAKETIVRYLNIEASSRTLKRYIDSTNNKRIQKLCDMLNTIMECFDHKSIQLCTFVSRDDDTVTVEF